MEPRIQHGGQAAKRLFAHLRMTRDLIRLIDSGWVHELELHFLERVPEKYVAGDPRAAQAGMPWWAPFKPGAGYPAGACMLFHIKLRSRPDPCIAYRLAECVGLVGPTLRRSGWMDEDGGRRVASMPLVVHTGRSKWDTPLQLPDYKWAPPSLRKMQLRMRCRLLDANDYAGDDAPDGNLARAALAVCAASADEAPLALERAEALFSAAGDEYLWRLFEAWRGPGSAGVSPA